LKLGGKPKVEANIGLKGELKLDQQLLVLLPIAQFALDRRPTLSGVRYVLPALPDFIVVPAQRERKKGASIKAVLREFFELVYHIRIKQIIIL
jgi:hypothetical protein